MQPISNSHRIKPVQTDMLQQLTEVKKTDTFFTKHIGDLPTRKTVLSEQQARPSKFIESFASLIKSDFHSTEALKPQSSITAPFIFLGKMGASIIGKFKNALNSLANPENNAKLGIDEMVKQAKKNSKKQKSLE